MRASVKPSVAGRRVAWHMFQTQIDTITDTKEAGHREDGQRVEGPLLRPEPEEDAEKPPPDPIPVLLFWPDFDRSALDK